MNATYRETPDALWSMELCDPPAGPPVVAGNLLLVATQESGPSAYHSALHALSPDDGSLHWQRSFEYALVSGLAAVQTLEILALVSTTSTDLIHGEGVLVALDATGNELRRWTPGAQRLSAPAVVGDMNIACVTADARTLLILDLATGAEYAKVTLEVNASSSAPALVDEVVYIPCRGPHLLAVGLDGRSHWRFDATESPDAWLDRTPVVVGEHLFAVLSNGAVVALRAGDGRPTWWTDVGPAGKFLSPPATDGERLFVGARDGFHALGLADGHEVWAFLTPRRIAAAPIVAGDVVYAACHDHHLYAFDPVTGHKLWQHEVERRIEVSPVSADCGEPARPCILITDRGGTLTAVAQPLGAEALKEHARSLEYGPYSDEERAAAWDATARAFEAEGKAEDAADCRREVARCLRQPIITLDVQYEGLMLNAWSLFDFTIRNEGYGPACGITIHASSEQFKGRAAITREIATLGAGDQRTEKLDIYPLEYGNSVPLRVRLEYADYTGEICSCEHTIYIAVARTQAARRKDKTTTSIFIPLSRQLAAAREHLRLIRERRSQYVMETDVPLDLIKAERKYERLITDLEAQLAQSGDAAAPALADEPEH